MRVIGCVSGFEDAGTLQTCLHVLRQQTDRVVYVDGAYKSFPVSGDGEHTPWDFPREAGPHTGASTDGSLGVAERMADRIVPCPPGGWENERVKRDAYLTEGEPGDYLFVVDADEVLFGKIDREYLREYDGWRIRLRAAREAFFPVFRVYKVPEHGKRLRHEGTHHNVCVVGAGAGGKAERSLLKECPERQALPGLRILHYPQYRRSNNRLLRRAEYYRGLFLEERAYRTVHKI